MSPSNAKPGFGETGAGTASGSSPAGMPSSERAGGLSTRGFLDLVPLPPWDTSASRSDSGIVRLALTLRKRRRYSYATSAELRRGVRDVNAFYLELRGEALADEYDVIIVGAGVAGLTAAMYSARYGLNTALMEQMMAGTQIINVERIENFPGFPQGISGAELVPLMQDQAMSAGAQFLMAEATGLVLDGSYKVIATTDGNYRAKAMIVAAGSRLKNLGIPGEEELYGSGVSHCATCDGPLFAGEVVGVVGGGDSAADEALTLTDHVDKVILFHRTDRLQAQRAVLDRLLRHPKVDVALNTVVESVVGEELVTGVQVRNVITNMADRVKLAGLFIYVGLEPNTEFIRGMLKTDSAGHIPVNLWMETEVPGIYAAGDIRQHSAAQLASAAGDGATAAIAAFRYMTAGR